MLVDDFLYLLQLFPSDDLYETTFDQKEFLISVSAKCKSEMEEVERKSSIKTVDVASLTSFDDNSFCKEIDELCPVLSAALKGASGATCNDKIGPHTLCYGALFKAWYAKNRSCVVSHRNDQLLFAAGAKKRTFKWFNKMGFTNSYSTALRKNKQLSANFDAPVVEWKNDVERDISTADEYKVRNPT